MFPLSVSKKANSAEKEVSLLRVSFLSNLLSHVQVKEKCCFYPAYWPQDLWMMDKTLTLFLYPLCKSQSKLSCLLFRLSHSWPGFDPTQRQCQTKPIQNKKRVALKRKRIKTRLIKDLLSSFLVSFATAFMLCLHFPWSVQIKETEYLFVQFHGTEVLQAGMICFWFESCRSFMTREKL